MRVSFATKHPIIIAIGTGLGIGTIVGLIQLGIDLFNLSVYASGQSSISIGLVMLISVLGWFAAGWLTGKKTDRDYLGIITGLCGGLVSIVVIIVAPLIVFMHRTAGAGSPYLFSSSIDGLIEQVPVILQLLGFSIGAAFGVLVR